MVGELPAQALSGLGEERPFGIYVHVPFCTVRCGYCDFNTYTASELGTPGGASGASRATYAGAAVAEVRHARSVLGVRTVPVDTVFFGGGTPTLLSPVDLGAVLAAVDDEFGLAEGVEVTTEANPDTVDAGDLEQLRALGFTRISFGMQSAVPHVLRVLDRTHDPERVPMVVDWARRAGFDEVSLDLIYGTPGETLRDWERTLEAALDCEPDHVLRVLDRTHDPERVPMVVDWARRAGFDEVSLDLIYGTPGETLADWERTLEAALDCEPDHVSAYSLIVEAGTALARKVRRGELSMPDEDDLADKYLLADERLGAAGLEWYEISNWARGEASRCRHNLGYWAGADWWGIGPGAHSHVGGVRWWNVKHPAAYAERIAAGRSPAAGHEVLDAGARQTERVLLELRLRRGLPVDTLDLDRARVERLVSGELVRREDARLVLTARGRLLADAVVRDLIA